MRSTDVPVVVAHPVAGLDCATVANPEPPISAQIHALCIELDALDNEIANLEEQVTALPTTLAALAGHPVLWLVLGREGVDRAGGLGTMVGQQVVTITRIDRRALVLVGAAMFLVGLHIGIGIHLWFGGI